MSKSKKISDEENKENILIEEKQIIPNDIELKEKEKFSTPIKDSKDSKIPLNVSFNNTFLQKKILSNKKAEKVYKLTNNNNCSLKLGKNNNSVRKKSSSKKIKINLNENIYSLKLTQMNKVIEELFIKERDRKFLIFNTEEKNNNNSMDNDIINNDSSLIFDAFRKLKNNVIC